MVEALIPVVLITVLTVNLVFFYVKTSFSLVYGFYLMALYCITVELEVFLIKIYGLSFRYFILFVLVVKYGLIFG